MVILAPQSEATFFFAKLAPVETTTEGIYLAGACQSPKDIPDSVAQAGAAAAAALSLLDGKRAYSNARWCASRVDDHNVALSHRRAA